MSQVNTDIYMEILYVLKVETSPYIAQIALLLSGVISKVPK